MIIIGVKRKNCEEWGGDGYKRSGRVCDLELTVKLDKIIKIIEDLGLIYIGTDATEIQNGYRSEATSIANISHHTYKWIDNIIVFDYPEDPLPDYSI